MRSLKHQILALLLGSLVFFAISFIILFGWHLRERAVAASIIKAKTDLAKCIEITNRTYPGAWRIQDGLLYKGDVLISGQTELVDYLAKVTGGTVTIFLGDTRAATTVRGPDGERAIGTKASDVVVQTVLGDGQVYLGEANVVGQILQTAYQPIWDGNGRIIGMFYVGVSKSFSSEMIADSLLKMALFGLFLIIIFGIIGWHFIERVIIRPLNNITLGTRDVATGHLTEKVEVTGSREIGELAIAFNQMVERLEGLAEEITRVTKEANINMDGELPGDNSLNLPEPTTPVITTQVREDKSALLQAEQDTVPEDCVSASNPVCLQVLKCLQAEGLPKGLNQTTLKHIMHYLEEKQIPVSAEDVAEGVRLTRVTVRRYLEFLENCGVLESEFKYGTVGRPVKLFCLKK